MIEYRDSVDGLPASQLVGFFENWPNPPSPETHLRVLQNSFEVLLAVDTEDDRVVVFITAISDGVLSAYISFLEVLPSYRSRGIGSELLRRLMNRLSDLYMVDLVCDSNLVPFYQNFGMLHVSGMALRNLEHQSGQPAE